MREYLRLLKLSDAPFQPRPALPQVRLALLGDHATQQLAKILIGVFRERGIDLVLHEGAFDTAAQEIHDAGSALYAFRPDFVWLSTCVQKYRDRFFACAPETREILPSSYLEELRAQLQTLQARRLPAIISSLALPEERSFGNFAHATLHSPYTSVARANRILSEWIGGTQGVFLLDVAYLAAQIGARNFFDEKLWALSRYPCAVRHLPEVAINLAAIVEAARGRLTKCLVLDLDNTLWGGTIGDDGVEGVLLADAGPGEIFQRFQRYLLTLKARGYVLAVCSKNEEAAARLPFRQHPGMVLREDDFAVFVANWNDKASNLEYIAKVLGLGLDSLIFIDDSPFERGQVRDRLPQVRVPEMPEEPADYIAFLERSDLFETTTFSDEDRQRAQMYATEAKRAAEEIKYGNIDDYLRSLSMKMTCSPFTSQNLPRISQLLARSNQFNLRTQRFSAAQCQAFAADPQRYFTRSFSVRDKFGDYGLIAVLCAEFRKDALQVLELAMSCRVLRRGVEQYVLSSLAEACRERGVREIRGEYLPTAKNAMVARFYDSFGFQRVESDASGRVAYAIEVERLQLTETFFTEAAA